MLYTDYYIKYLYLTQNNYLVLICSFHNTINKLFEMNINTQLSNNVYCEVTLLSIQITYLFDTCTLSTS